MSSKNQIFISGLPYESTEEEISEIFEECGEIIELKLPTYRDSGRLLGYGHITFKTDTQASKVLNYLPIALEKDQMTIGKRYINVQMAKEKRSNIQENNKVPPKECKTIFVKNLSYSLTEDELGDFFCNCGEIENVRIVYNDSQKSKSKGFGYVDFKQPESVSKAMKLHGKALKNRNIIIDFDESKAKKGFRLNINSETNTKYCKEKNLILNKKIYKEKSKVFNKTKTQFPDKNKNKKFNLF